MKKHKHSIDLETSNAVLMDYIARFYYKHSNTTESIYKCYQTGTLVHLEKENNQYLHPDKQTKMNKTRLEAFSDGVLAIIITIMVLEIKVPHGTDWSQLIGLLPVFFSYVISFLLVGIYWGNHHHLLHTLKQVNSNIILANLNLLFWLSLVPFATGWMGENHFAPNTIIVYSTLLICCGLSYGVLQNGIIKSGLAQKEFTDALKKQNRKILISFSADLAAIPFAFVNPVISAVLLTLQSLIWLIPDKNIEKALKKE